MASPLQRFSKRYSHVRCLTSKSKNRQVQHGEDYITEDIVGVHLHRTGQWKQFVCQVFQLGRGFANAVHRVQPSGASREVLDLH
jgi:hypothetical protein